MCGVPKVIKWLRKQWSKFSEGALGGLIRSGSWRVRYSDGNVTYWLSYGDAKNLKACFGGSLEWQGDFKCAEYER